MNRKNIHLWICTLIMLCSICLTIPITANADSIPSPVIPAVPTNVTQASASANSIRIQWTAVANAEYYDVAWSVNQQDWVTEPCIAIAAASKAESYNLWNLNVGTSYVVKVRTHYLDASMSEWSAPIEVTTLPSSIAAKNITLVSKTDAKLAFKWTPSVGAQGYEIRFSYTNDFKNAKPIATVTKTAYEYNLTNFHEPVGYFSVTPIRYTTVANKKRLWRYSAGTVFKFSTPLYAPENVAISSLNYKKSKVTFTFNRTKSEKLATSYELELYDSAGKAFKTVSLLRSQQPTTTIKNKLLFKQPFMYRMRSVHTSTVTKKVTYSAWSPLITYTPDATCLKLKKKKTKTKKGKTQTVRVLYYNKVVGATNYSIYHSNDCVNWTLVKTTSKTHCKVPYKAKTKKTKKKKAKKLKNYYYVKANNVAFGKRLTNSSDPQRAIKTYYLK